MSEKTWSIIIPARNEEKCIARCLDSICALRTDLSEVEVIVVDNASTDRTVAIAESYSGRLNIRVLTIGGIRVGALRNAAASRSQGRVLAFVDADCLVQPDWLNHAARVVAAYPSAVVGAYYALPADAGWPARLWHERFHEGRSGDTSYLPGGNIIVERQLFWKIGGFDPNLTSNEDSQFCSRARSTGARVVAVPELATVHLGAERDLRHFIRRQMWHGSNVISRAALRGNARAIGLAAYTLTCLSSLLLGLLIQNMVLCVTALVALLIPPLALAVRKGAPRRSRNLPPLMLLLLTYAVVRAFVLPVAILRHMGHRPFRQETAG